MFRHIAAIAAIFAGTCVGWLILGSTVQARTEESTGRMRDKVVGLWGGPHAQYAPVATDGERISQPHTSDVNVVLHLEYRRKGLLWYSTYTSDFQAAYDFRNEEDGARAMVFTWPFPASGAIYDGLQFTVDGNPITPQLTKDSASLKVNLASKQSTRLEVRYRSQGLESWRYRFGEQISSLPNFHMRIKTDFKDVDFEDNSLSPTSRTASGDGWQLDWTYQNLFAGREIALIMPQRAQPGPLASQISFFAPVSLLFYFFVMLMLSSMRGIKLHPAHYFFLACSFFAFHLLMSYLADHVDIYVAFAISSAVSVFLAVTYLRLIAGTKFAVRDAGLAQFVYLVLFSFAFFFQGFTGLAVTLGAIVTLFVTMQLTARVQWNESLFE